jgi:hypothetical protein
MRIRDARVRACLRVASLSVFLPACAPAAAPDGKPSVMQGPKASLMPAVAHAYGAAGHKCVVDEDGDAVCDKDDPGKPTLVFVYDDSGAGRRVQVVSAYIWKSKSDPCASLFPKLNEIEKADVWFRFICTPESLSFVGSMNIPERGLTDRDVVAYADAFSASIANALQVGGLFEYLK